MTRKNLILKIAGGICTILGIAANILMFVSGAYPTYLFFVLIGIGILFLLIAGFAGKIRPAIQIAITLFPFIVLYALYLFHSPSKDTFLIPDNFRGTIYVYYDQKNGLPEEYENSRRIYRIPSDGILVTKFKLINDVIDLSGSRYYLVDKKGSRKELKHYSVHDELIDTTQVDVIYGVCGQDGDYGTFQTFYVDYPTKGFLSKDETMYGRVKHDSIMKIKTGR